jgi:hypothetical protein
MYLAAVQSGSRRSHDAFVLSKRHLPALLVEADIDSISLSPDSVPD